MGSITINGKKVKSITINGKTVKSLTMGGKVLTLINLNSFTGTFSSQAKQAEFMGLITRVSDHQFQTESGITGIVIPDVTTIGVGSFQRCQLTTLSLPKTTNVGSGAFQSSLLTSLTAPVITDIGAGAFHGSHLTTLNLPKVIAIGVQAFYHSPLTSINVPKATTIGDQAFHSVVNAATTEVTMNKVFITSSQKDGIFGAGNWNHITFHWLNDDGSIYNTSHNSFVGTFSSQAKEAEFMGVTDTVSEQQFNAAGAPEGSITGISLPDVITIGNYAFSYSPLTSINVPKATTIGELVFYSIVNNASTIVTMNKKFNTDAEKNKIFGAGNWSNVTFKWLNDDGTTYVPAPTKNAYTGTFSSGAKQTSFMATTENIGYATFAGQYHLTGITLPHVINIGGRAFYDSPLTHIDVRKATRIDYSAFQHVVNAPSTEVWMKNEHNTDSKKNSIFGAGNWNNITFHWV